MICTEKCCWPLYRISARALTNAFSLTRSDFLLTYPYPFVQLATLKQRTEIREKRINDPSWADKMLNIGRDRLFNLLGEYRLLVPVKRAYHKTTTAIIAFTGILIC